MLPWVEVGVFCLFVGLDLRENFSLLLLCQLFAVNASVFASNLGQSFSVLCLFVSPLLSRRFLGELWRLNVVLGRHEVKLDVGLDAANLIVWLGLYDVNLVLFSSKLNVNRVALVKDRIVRKFLFKAAS